MNRQGCDPDDVPLLVQSLQRGPSLLRLWEGFRSPCAVANPDVMPGPQEYPLSASHRQDPEASPASVTRLEVSLEIGHLNSGDVFQRPTADFVWVCPLSARVIPSGGEKAGGVEGSGHRRGIHANANRSNAQRSANRRSWQPACNGRSESRSRESGADSLDRFVRPFGNHRKCGGTRLSRTLDGTGWSTFREVMAYSMTVISS